jgi:glucosamine kinase
MILVADSGSTKAEWVAAGNETADGSLFTSGISPIYLGEEEIVKLLEKELGSLAGKNFERVYFYGTGCNSTVNEDIVKRALHRFSQFRKGFCRK